MCYNDGGERKNENGNQSGKDAGRVFKARSRSFDFGPEIIGAVDVSAGVFAEILDLNERTVREYGAKGIVVRSQDNPGLYRFEASVHAYLDHLFRSPEKFGDLSQSWNFRRRLRAAMALSRRGGLAVTDL